jgi:hypothetical protein
VLDSGLQGLAVKDRHQLVSAKIMDRTISLHVVEKKQTTRYKQSVIQHYKHEQARQVSPSISSLAIGIEVTQEVAGGAGGTVSTILRKPDVLTYQLIVHIPLVNVTLGMSQMSFH